MKLRLIDNLPPEDLAMLQALYSRSAQSVSVHLDKVAAGGSSRFMQDYVAGYNHKSIADCGSTTVFIEGVSLLAAKAIQDWPLYSGQETSTRYIDMSKQPIVDPFGTPASKAILDAWMDFYRGSQETVAAHVARVHPRRESEDEKKYQGAVKARTFDILRGFLPAGICTQLSWHTNLRQAGDRIALLVQHPAPEIADLGRALRIELSKAYPDSGLGKSLPSVSGVAASELQTEREVWEQKVAEATTYYWPLHGEGSPWECRINMDYVHTYFLRGAERELLASRPRGCVLPHFMSRVGPIHLEGFLDFGSFRDLQRHRNGVCRMPLHTTHFGFEPWYVDQLPEELQLRARALIAEQTDRIEEIRPTSTHPLSALKQYLIPLGFKMPLQCTYPFPAFVYLLEMRSAKTVHPTLRKLVLHMIGEFRVGLDENIPVALHVDEDPDDWTVRRGGQTIERRE
jgi:thymidylate synthase ThyX